MKDDLFGVPEFILVHDADFLCSRELRTLNFAAVYP